MNNSRWNKTIAELEAVDHLSAAAAARLHAEATLDDIPRLIELLERADNFFVREAAAWPLAELAGVQVLPALLRAYQKGFDEGHDNDGFTAALMEVPAMFPSAAKAALSELAQSADAPTRGHAKWLLEFCTESET